MSQLGHSKRKGAQFFLGIGVLVISIIALTAYIIGASYPYYSDVNITIIGFTLSGIIITGITIFYGKQIARKKILGVSFILVTVVLAISVMFLLEVRVYSMAVLLGSDLEKDNVGGYQALYISISAMVAYLIAIILNVTRSFMKI